MLQLMTTLRDAFSYHLEVTSLRQDVSLFYSYCTFKRHIKKRLHQNNTDSTDQTKEFHHSIE